jgi:hypothetical protein
MTAVEPLPTLRKYREASIDPETATVRAALFDDSTAYSPDRVNHEFVADVLDGGTTATELGASSYSRQGVADVQVTEDATNVEVVLGADDITFPNLDGGETIQGYLVYIQIGGDDTTPGDDPIIAIEDEVTNSNGNKVTTNGSDVTISLSSSGIIRSDPA